MTSTINITLDATTPLRVGRCGRSASVEIGSGGHVLAIHAEDPNDLERLAAECLTAANPLRAAVMDGAA